MDDFGFNYPKKILRWILVGAFLIAIAWGVITGDSKNFMNLWIKEVEFITKPIINRITNRMERAVERAQESSETATTTESGN